jgi:hypothetical protein
MKKLFLTGIAALFLATGTAHARSVITFCDGIVGWHPLSAYTAVISNYGTPEVKNECIFVTRSKLGRTILKTCHKGSSCSIKAIIDNVSGEYEINAIFSVEDTSDD